MEWIIQQPGGDALGQFRRTLSKRLTIAAARAADKAAQGARDDIRRDMRAANLGGLARTISSTSDLKKQRVRSGDGSALDVAGFVTVRNVKSPRTAGALRSYLDQETTNILPVRGTWLAIPTQEIPSKVARRKMTPDLYRKAGLEEKIGPLVFVKGPRPGIAYLIVNNVSISLKKSGRARRLPKRGGVRAGRANVSIIAFILVRQSRRSRRVDPRAHAEKWARRLPSLLQLELAADRGSTRS